MLHLPTISQLILTGFKLMTVIKMTWEITWPEAIRG